MTNPDGVPPLADPGVVFEAPDAVTSDGTEVKATSLQSLPWGIFDAQFNPVIVGDSVLTFDYGRDSEVSNYPVEKGGFESYNKVQTPFRIKFQFTKAGNASERSAFLDSVEKAQNSLDLLVAVTSDGVYQNVTVDHYDFRRSARSGVELLTVDVWCEEVRLAAAPQFSNSSDTPALTDTKDPEAETAVNDGPVQATTPGLQASASPEPTASGTPEAALSPPATITSPSISLTNSAGNVPPASIPSAIQSLVTYVNSMGPQAGAVSGVTFGAAGQTTAYILPTGGVIPVNEVTNILAPGFTVVQ